jgi:hypothetical protein
MFFNLIVNNECSLLLWVMLLIINVELFNLNLEPTIKRLDCYSFKNKIEYVYLWNNTAFDINSIREVYIYILNLIQILVF